MISYIKQHIRKHFGSTRGFGKAIYYRLLTIIGVYKKYQVINFTKITRMIFVCSGNICRSPMAEFMARKLGAASCSFGLHCRGGDPADPRVVEFANHLNIDISSHVTRNIKDYIAAEGDLIVVMEPSQLDELEGTIPPGIPITLLALWSRSPSAYLHDPFSCSPYFFSKSEALVVSHTQTLLTYAKNPAQH